MKKKFNLLNFILLCVIMVNYEPLRANPIPEEMKSFSRKSYNRLPLSHEADQTLQRNGNLSACLQEAAVITEKYGVSDSIGFRLLHRHEKLEKGKVMVERFDHWQSNPALITTVEDKEGTKTYPASWSCQNGALQVFEYSEDPNVKKVANVLGKNLTFFEEMRVVLEKHGLDHILAPAILVKDSLVHFDSTKVLYELISSNPYASILVTKSFDELDAIRRSQRNVIQTTWGLDGNNKLPVNCVTYCEQWHSRVHAETT